jgi:hypothetical protein
MTLSKIEKDHCKAIGMTEAKFKWFRKQHDKAEKEGRIVPMKIDDKGYPYVELETEEK